MSNYGSVRFNQIRNDLFWEVLDLTMSKYIRWQGYNDYYWWKNVATSDEWQVRGNLRLDPITGTITIIKENK